MFLTLIAIITSVISAVYYLNIIKETFFYTPNYNINPLLKNLTIPLNVYDKYNNCIKSINFNHNNITIASPISFTISVITLIILLFMFMNKE